MNGLKKRRIELGLSQPEVVNLLRESCPKIDVALYSKMENGHCMPNADTLEALESVLQASRIELFSLDDMQAMCDDMPLTEEHSPVYTMLLHTIPVGRGNAITREALAAKLGMSDRAARKAIEAARAEGLLIMCQQNGSGYFISDDIQDMKAQFRQDTNRALSVLRRRKPLRDALKAAGQAV